MGEPDRADRLLDRLWGGRLRAPATTSRQKRLKRVGGVLIWVQIGLAWALLPIWLLAPSSWLYAGGVVAILLIAVNIAIAMLYVRDVPANKR